MNYFILLCLIFTFCNQNIFASDGSDATRAKQTIGLSLIPIGYGPNPSLALGATFNLYISKDTILDFEFIQSGSMTSDIFTSNKVTLLNESYGIHVRQFLTSSFYIKLGVDQRTVDYKYETYNGTVYTENTTFSVVATSGLFSIGNEWQLKNFILGIDWIGVSVPINSEVTKEYISSTATATQTSDLRSAENLKLKTSIPIVLRLIVGFSF